jgi:hypothetical protein
VRRRRQCRVVEAAEANASCEEVLTEPLLPLIVRVPMPVCIASDMLILCSVLRCPVAVHALLSTSRLYPPAVLVAGVMVTERVVVNTVLAKDTTDL